MSEAVSVPSLMMMTSTVSEESLARDTHTETHTDSGSVVYVKIYKVVSWGGWGRGGEGGREKGVERGDELGFAAGGGGGGGGGGGRGIRKHWLK